jgi:hypothetical protein
MTVQSFAGGANEASSVQPFGSGGGGGVAGAVRGGVRALAAKPVRLRLGGSIRTSKHFRSMRERVASPALDSIAVGSTAGMDAQTMAAWRRAVGVVLAGEQCVGAIGIHVRGRRDERQPTRPSGSRALVRRACRSSDYAGSVVDPPCKKIAPRLLRALRLRSPRITGPLPGVRDRQRRRCSRRMTVQSASQTSE